MANYGNTIEDSADLAVSVYLGCNVLCLFHELKDDFGSSISPGPPLTFPLQDYTVGFICYENVL